MSTFPWLSVFLPRKSIHLSIHLQTTFSRVTVCEASIIYLFKWILSSLSTLADWYNEFKFLLLHVLGEHGVLAPQLWGGRTNNSAILGECKTK